LYSPPESDELLANFKPIHSYKTTIEVTTESTLEAVQRLLAHDFTKVLALNFASAKNPGGGFLNGSAAQEESLARASGLYECIVQMKEMYDYNRKLGTALYSDYMIYSPAVPVFKDDSCNLLDRYYNCSFITMPAVNAGVVREREPQNRKLITITMERRIEKVLAVAVSNAYEIIVLGAFGCGVFKNDPEDIANLFKRVLTGNKFNGQFRKVVFAIYDRNPKGSNITAFRKVLLNESLS
jgi:uncharacterized protein (TIGR02452 family)